MRKLLIGLVLSVVASAASAEWVLVVTTAAGDKSYADPKTKRRTGNTVRIWEIADFAKPMVTDRIPFYSNRIYRQYDCAERTGQSLQITSFVGQMATGAIEGTLNTPGSKSFIAPNTIGEALLDFACK
jgi:hypothetical protein